MAVAWRVVPGLAALRGYRRSWLRGDLLAGVTVAAYLVPQVMAYATLAGLPAIAGLWAMLPAMLVYAVFGSSRLLSVGPESTTALMTATVVGPLAGGDPGRYAALAAELAVIVGLLALAAWALRLGLVADLLSQPILVGYMAGVALVMMAGQLEKTSGIPVHGSGFVDQVSSFARSLGQVHPGTLAVAGTALAFLFALHRWPPRAPGPLLAVLLGTAAVMVFGLEQAGIAVVGDVPAGLPRPDPAPLGDLPQLLLPAAGLLIVGYSDNVLTARAFTAHGHVPGDPPTPRRRERWPPYTPNRHAPGQSSNWAPPRGCLGPRSHAEAITAAHDWMAGAEAAWGGRAGQVIRAGTRHPARRSSEILITGRAGRARQGCGSIPGHN